jgi:mono/diheme cytochrome c family protein
VRASLLVLAALLGVVSAAAQSKGNPRQGQALYEEKCVLCHGGAGQGWDWSKKVEKPPVPVPDLSTVVPARDDAFLFSVVRDGGEAVGKSRFMPPFGFQLSDQEVWDLVAYMRSLKGKP